MGLTGPECTAGRGLPDFGVTAPRTWLASPSAPSPSRDHRTTTTIRVAVEVGPGQHETQRVVPLVEALDAKGMLPEKLAGDKGYSARWVREYLLAEGVEPVTRIDARDRPSGLARRPYPTIAQAGFSQNTQFRFRSPTGHRLGRV